MNVLAIDSANMVMGVSVINEEKVLGEMITNVKRNHSIRLMPAISDLMKEVSMKPQELDRIVVAEGPGSYTGVRIGVTIAKTMAWTMKKELVGVSSLEILAQNGRFFHGLIVPLFDARRGQVYTGLYRSTKQTVNAVEKDRLCLLDHWLEELKEQPDDILFLGNDLSIHKQAIEEKLGEKAVFAEMALNNPRPSDCARIGLAKTPVEDIHLFVPTYLQLAEAEAKWLAAQKGLSHL